MKALTRPKTSVVLLLLSGTLIYYFANLQKVLVPGATFNEIQQLFSLDAASVTKLGAVFMFIYAGAQLFVGVLADRYSGAKVIIFGGIAFVIGSIFSACDYSLNILYASRFLTGLGAATIYLSMVKEISLVTGKAMPMYLGIMTLIGYSGAITGAAPFISGVKHFGYQKMMFSAGMATLMIYLIFVICFKKNPAPAVCKDVKLNITTLLSVLKIRHNVMLILTLGLSFGSYFALQSILAKKFLEDFCQLSSKSAGLVMTVTMTIAAVNGFVVASISRVCGNRRRPVMLFCGWGCFTGMLMIFSAVLFNIRSPWLVIAGIVILSFAGNVAPISATFYKETNEPNKFGTVLSVSNFFAYIITAGMGSVSGKLMDLFPCQEINGIYIYSRNSYLLVFAVFLGIGIISGTTSLFLRETYGKNISVK